VLVIMVGKTVQVCQVVGWLPVHPIGDLRLPYWAGLWFGIFPTWEGVVAQVGAAAFVVGSYAGAEWIRARRRRAIRSVPVPQPAASRAERQPVPVKSADAERVPTLS
jgi:high-affinity iron transporter